MSNARMATVVRKTDEAPAAYLVEEAEAHVVRRVYEMYTAEGLSIGKITRRLNAEGIPTAVVAGNARGLGCCATRPSRRRLFRRRHAPLHDAGYAHSADGV